MNIPSTKRKVMSLIYESMLLFGIIFSTCLFYGIVSNQRNALHHRLGLQITVFIVLGLYFIWCWTKSGQTLAMKTWGLQLQTVNKNPISFTMAIKRYILGWIYLFLPTVLVYIVFKEVKFILYVFLINIMLNLIYMHFNKNKQMVYDRLLGLEIVKN